MVEMERVFRILVTFCILGTMAAVEEPIYACQSPIYCSGPLLNAVQMARVFPDSKTFVDMPMKQSESDILQAFTALDAQPGNLTKSALKDFVEEYFEEPGAEFEDWTPDDYTENPSFADSVKDPELKTFGKELCGIWEVLGRKIKAEVRDHQDRHSLLYVEKPFIVPGGRFRETYYWDSLWVVEGLLRCDMSTTVKGMLENFMAVIDKVGFIPNGLRVYYEMRSQPPLFAWMVDRYYQKTKDVDFLREALPRLDTEMTFWTTNRSTSVVKGQDTYTLYKYGTIINRPRPESHYEDVETAKMVEGDPDPVYSNLASAAESGWDFSSRWFSPEATSYHLSFTVTKDIIPVDLNSILCHNERLMASFYNVTGDSSNYRLHMDFYEGRKEAIQSVLWNEARGVWQDYHQLSGSHRDFFFPSNVFPMYAGCYGTDATERKNLEQRVVDYLKSQNIFDYVGGIPTSLTNTTQQWDLPNAWPPLQHVVIRALAEGQLDESKSLARQQAQSWVYTNWLGWNNTKHMFEKYDFNRVGRRGGGGEYGVQTGFGWTNGVVLDLLGRYGDTLTTNTAETSAANILQLSWTISIYCSFTIFFAVFVMF